MSTTLTLFMIVKNESSIISRCLDSVKNYIDYIVISDTGSSDNTIEIINNYLINNNIKGKIYKDEWKNFGYNRTKSLMNAHEWLDEQKIDRNTNYLLTIDADMIINFSDSFQKDDLLKFDYWSICQYNSSIRYYNSRFFKANFPFKCISVTHEYWSCINHATYGKLESVSIDDRGDGGCKSNKFERDIELLKKGLEDEPDNHRYYFYLAQSYYDSGNIDEAIKWYKKRIDAGGWFEEIFISYKKIGELYLLKEEDEKALYYWTLAYDIVPERSETLYKISNYYRNKGKNKASLMYIKSGLCIPYPKDLVLFLEYPIYNYKFLEELSIVAYYSNKKKEGLLACQYILLNIKDNIPNYIRESTFNNNFFYINSIDSISNSKLIINTRNPYTSSSPCLIYNEKENKYQGVIRAVNYSITDNFSYNIRGGNNVSTINYWTEFDENFNNISHYEIDCKTDKIRNTHINGFEDIRICILNDKVYGIAVDWEHCEYNHPSILLLHFDLINGLNGQRYVINTIFTITYKNYICQKNWTLFTENSKIYVLYSHHPLTILEINQENGDYKIIKETYSDYNLKDIRGSANPIKIGKEWLILVHEVIHKDTRKYYHRFLKYSSNWDLLAISEPFYLKEFFVEFSLSITNIHKDTGDIINIFYSSRDNTSEVLSVEYSLIKWLPSDIKNYLINVL